MDLEKNKSNIDNEDMFPMIWTIYLRFLHPPNFNLVKCFNSPIVVNRDSMDLQLNKSNIDNEEMFPMVWVSSLRFFHIIAIIT
jgi:hypothetical protein